MRRNESTSQNLNWNLNQRCEWWRIEYSRSKKKTSLTLRNIKVLYGNGGSTNEPESEPKDALTNETKPEELK